jgi:uncharacterized protein (DUF3084 family)
MSDVEELRARMDAVEAALAKLREDAEATRTMASLADRDVAEHRQGLKSVVSVMNALRQTQLEQGQVLGMLVTGQARAEAQLVALEAQGVALAGAVGHLAEGQRQLTERVDAIGGQVGAMGTVLARLADKLLPPEA